MNVWRKTRRTCLGAVLALFCVCGMGAVSVLAAKESRTVLEVGPGRAFERIEEAVSAAEAGTEIVVYPKKDREPYTQVRVLVRTPKITIRSVEPKRPIVLDGGGFDYSGSGSVPRAIV